MEFGAEVHRILALDASDAENNGKAADMPHAYELASRFTGSKLGQRAARAIRIEREFDFLFYFEDVVLRGQIDLWFEEAGELVVLDYKTDRLADHEIPSAAYALQLQIYALALERYAGRVADRAALYYLRPDRVIEVPIDPEAARVAVRAFLDAQDSLEYPMKPGEQCRRCAFFGNGCVGIGAVESVERATG
jgi:CRISPR-associated protein Cas4